ncbi:MAG: hypothetical protein NDI84_00415 [Steroidobacteraceae bacterium]|nr:hypothetical protein [Steroidobacteraceae bacterium]
MADLDLIDRYLAGRLADAERDALEARLVAEPGLRSEFALTEALREGLGHLESRGELAQPPESQRSGRPLLAIAASVAAGLLGLLSLVLYQQVERVRDELAAVTRDLARAAPLPTSSVTNLRLERRRGAGSAPEQTWQRPPGPAQLGLAVDLGPDPAAAYSVRLMRIDSAAEIVLLAWPAVAGGPDGDLALSVHSSLLQPGDYRLDLQSLDASGAPQHPVTSFSLRIVE